MTGYIKQYNLCMGIPSCSTFEYSEYKKAEKKIRCDIKLYALIFCLEGHLKVSSNRYNEEYLCAGEVIFIPRGCDYTGEALSETTLLVHYFSIEECNIEDCTLFYLFVRREIYAKRDVFSKLEFNDGLDVMLRSIRQYMKDGVSDTNIDILKHKELIWLFSKYYPSEELRIFFSSLSDDAIPFKGVVLSHYRKAANVNQLADLCGYGVHTFRRVFKREFGESPYQWLSNRKSEHIMHRLSHSYIPFCDIMDEFHFTSHSNFTKFCKRFLGDTPTKLRVRLVKEAQNRCSK